MKHSVKYAQTYLYICVIGLFIKDPLPWSHTTITLPSTSVEILCSIYSEKMKSVRLSFPPYPHILSSTQFDSILLQPMKPRISYTQLSLRTYVHSTHL